MKIVRAPMPPSVNALYFTKGNKRILTSEGRIYKDTIKSVLAEAAKSGDYHSLENHKLSIRFDLFFPQIENKNYLLGKGKTRFKRFDISNRVKVLEDALVEGLGIDDSQFFTMMLSKNLSTDGNEYVDVYLYDLEIYDNEGLPKH